MDPTANATEQLIFVFVRLFLSILYEASPFIVLGALIAGVLEELIPQQWIARAIPRSRFLAIAVSGLLGLVFPMCECGIVPVMRRLLRKGVPLSCCVTYMLAGPIINGVVMLSTWVAFSNPGDPADRTPYVMLGLRVGLGYVTAVVTALVVERMHAKYGNALLTAAATPPAPSATSLTVLEDGSPAPADPWGKRAGRIAQTALADYVDITVFLILGAVLAATTRMVLKNEDIVRLAGGYPVLTILLMMGLAIMLCLCSEADAFVAASFRELSPAPKLAFLVLGPMLDFKLYFLFTRVFRPRLILTIVVCTVVQVFAYTCLLQLIEPALGLSGGKL